MARGYSVDKETVINRIPKGNKGNEIQIRIIENKGKKYMDIREYYRDDDPESPTYSKLLPGKGIRIPDDLVDEVACTMLKNRPQKDTDENE
jgi:hypothetical protein